MHNCLLKVVFFIISFSALRLQAAPGDIPVSLQRQLAVYQQKDSLEAWIYARIDYTDKQPQERIGFLMQTQQAAWRSYRTYKERLAWFDLLALQGYYQLQTGNILHSINAYEKTLQFYESYPLPDVDIIEDVLKPLGNNYTRLADYNTALYIQQKTLLLAQKTNDAGLIASVYSNMAISARWKGDPGTAEDYCRYGLKNVSANTALHGLLLSTYASVLTDQARYDTARIACMQALKILNRHRKNETALYWYTGALQVAANIALQQQEFRPAENYAIQAGQLLQQGFPLSRQREKAKVQVLLGDIASRSGHAAASLTCYQQALVLLIPSFKLIPLSAIPPEEAIYSENTIADALAGKATAFMQLGKNKEALQHFLMAFAAERKLRKEFFYAESRFRELEVTRSRSEAAMKAAYELWKASGSTTYLDQLLLVAELSKAQVLTDERAARSATNFLPDSLAIKEKQLQQTIAYYQRELITTENKAGTKQLLQSAEYELALLQKDNKAPDAGKILSTDRLQKMLAGIPPGIVMLEFFAGNDCSYILEFTSGGARSVRLIAKKQVQAGIRRFMQQWFYNASAVIDAPKEFYAECHELYAFLFGDYSWQPGKRYIIIPDGSFNYLPFDALITDKTYTANYAGWPWLFKKNVISLAYSLQTWMQQQSAGYTATAFKGFFISRPKQQQAFLSVQKEYEALQQQLHGEFYLDEAAGWDRFNQSITHTGILHLSTHGFSANNDSFPKLELYDRPFYLFDLRHKNFSTALVVLSACETADGSLIEGEGVNSLSRGFTAA
jgi:CHAT domain-containing protein